MNCCDEYGRCQQGHGCPAHTTPVEPAQNPPYDWFTVPAWLPRAVLYVGSFIGIGYGLGRFLKLF